MNSAEPASTAPTGQPKPLLKSTHTESKGAAKRAAFTPDSTTALRSRAPSMCSSSPCALAVSPTASMVSSGQIVPPP